jgi:hypothetical protein
MEDTIRTFLDALIRTSNAELPVVTAYLDLSAGSETAPGPAETVVRRGIMTDIDAREATTRDALRSLESDLEGVQAAVLEARREGVRGLAYLGCAGAGVQHVLSTPLPFRNDVRVGTRGWVFELERYSYLFERPISLVTTDMQTADMVRIRFGSREAERSVAHDPHFLTKRKGRSDVQGRGGTPEAGFGGGHSKNRVEQIVEAKRAMFAKEAASEVTAFAGADDLFFVAGVDEARAQLLNALPPELAARARLLPAAPAERSDRELAEFALQHGPAAQREETSMLIERALSGGSGGRWISGAEAISRAFDDGRVGELIVHEDSVDHWGSADDARFYESTLDDNVIERLIEEAERTSASLRFGLDPVLLAEHEGVLATLRW